MAWTFEATQAGYRNLWRSATVKPGDDDAAASKFADKIIANEAKYKAVQAATGVPWFFIGGLHMRESSCNFAGVLHNGEHIIGTGRQTSLVPEGRGPFSSWEEAAIDALKLKNMQRVQAWSPERMMFEAEVFNGLGYTAKGINSPYVWAGTTQEQSGKYVADHVFDRSAEDTQLGVAAVLKRLVERRPDIAAVLNAVAPGGEPGQPVDPIDPNSPTAPLPLGNPMLQQLLAMLLPLLLQALSGKPLTLPAPESKPVPSPAPPSPVTQPPGTIATDVRATGLGLLGWLGALGGGMVGMPGETMAGTLVPLLVTAAGFAGIPAPLAKIGGSLLSTFGGWVGGKLRPKP